MIKYEDLEIVNGNIHKTFFKFTFPNVVGFVAMSSVALVDGYFVSHYVNSVALAAVNIIIPLITVIYGIAIMLTIGAAVLIGTYLGQSKYQQASSVFTKVIITISAISFFFTVICYVFSEQVAIMLHANDEIMVYAVPYLEMISLFFFFQAIEYALSVITRTDGNPYLASFAVIFGAILNLILDYIFVVHMDMGISGAALGTGLSFVSSTIILLFHFILKKGNLYLTKILDKWNEMILAAYNGSSELLSEASVAIIAYLFNKIMVTELGTYGVEAFTVINYSLWLTNMLCYAIGDSLVPLLSINYGAKKYNRIQKILSLSRINVIGIGLIMFLLFAFIPEIVIGYLLNSTQNPESFALALEFASYIKYTFLFIGLNIIFSSSFTAFQLPLHSVTVGLSRGLILPVIFIFTLPLFMGNTGLYVAVPLAEFSTIIFGYILWRKTKIINNVMSR